MPPAFFAPVRDADLEAARHLRPRKLVEFGRRDTNAVKAARVSAGGAGNAQKNAPGGPRINDLEPARCSSTVFFEPFIHY